MKPPLGFGILELSEFKMENDFCKNLERWSGRIEMMLCRCVAAICKENNEALREEIMEDYAALCAAKIAIERMFSDRKD